MKRQFVFLFMAGLLLACFGKAQALPRFAALTGSKCQSCHVNPAGGGMRNAFGAQFGREELPVPGWSEEAGVEDLTKLLPSFLGIGADFRTLYLVRQIPDSLNGVARVNNEFWQMQGDIYFNFRIAKKVNLYFKKGLYSGFEAFGLLRILPLSGQVKIGKFLPNYGLRLDDHTAFIRTYTGFSPESGRPELTGLEASIMPGPLTIAGGIYNASDGFGGTGSSAKAYLGRAEGMFDLGEGKSVGVGVNLFRRNQATETTTLYGCLGSVGFGGFTLLGEGDLLKVESSFGSRTGVLLYGEATYGLIDGLDLKLAYDFYDPDKEYKTGYTSRYSFGAEFFPLSGVAVTPMYRVIVEDPTDVKNNEFHFLFHIYL
jgi:hypothetical protein